MKIYLSPKNKKYYAVANYDIKSKKTRVLKGSIVSKDIKCFKGERKVQTLRNKLVKDGVLQEDIEFNSLSTAASFISGRSKNGLLSWKTENKISMKQYLSMGN